MAPKTVVGRRFVESGRYDRLLAAFRKECTRLLAEKETPPKQPLSPKRIVFHNNCG
jgi:hypothetical protein